MLFFVRSVYYFLFRAKDLLITANKDKKKMYNAEVFVDEAIDPYFESLTATDQKQWYANEVYLQNKLQIKTLSDENLEKLRTNQKSNKVIQGCPNYDILFNPDYQHIFHYIPLCQRHSDEDTISDVITKLFYLSPHYHSMM